MRSEVITCDCCGAERVPSVHTQKWDEQYSVFKLTLPRDGVNGGAWSMDVCPSCREQLHDTIRTAIDRLRNSTTCLPR